MFVDTVRMRAKKGTGAGLGMAARRRRTMKYSVFQNLARIGVFVHGFINIGIRMDGERKLAAWVMKDGHVMQEGNLEEMVVVVVTA